MKRNILNKLAVVLCLLALYSCKAKKHLLADRRSDTSVMDSITAASKKTDTVVTPKAAATLPPSDKYVNFKLEKLKAIRAKQVDFKTFSGKANAKLNIDGDSHDVTLNIRIKKNQQIWVSITYLLGVEVARAMITPDSIKIMNRLESTYLKQPFSYIYTYTSRQISYQTLEALLVGNAVPALIGDSADLKPDNGNLMVTGDLQGLLYQLNIGTDLRVNQTHLSNNAAGQSLQVNNSVFVLAGNHVIPSQISINSIAGEKKIQADLHYNKLDFDQNLSYPFSVPARFTTVK